MVNYSALEGLCYLGMIGKLSSQSNKVNSNFRCEKKLITFTVKFWFLANLQAKHWINKNISPEDRMILNIESFVLDRDEEKYRQLWNVVFGDYKNRPSKLNKNSVFTESIGEDNCILSISITCVSF